MINIHLHGALKHLAAKALPLCLDVQTPAEALRALCILIPGFKGQLRTGIWRITADKEVLSEDLLSLRFGAHKHFHIYPETQGAGLTGTAVFWIIALTAGVSVASFALAPSLDDYGAREAVDKRASYLFNGAVNTQEQGGVVPLIFGGPIKVGSTVVSAGITSERVSHTTNFTQNLQSGHAWGNRIGLYGAYGGRGGGGGKPHTPVEGNNTLQTHATIRAVDLLGEGELRGLVNGLKSVFIDGVPIQNEDDSPNVQGIQLEWRSGLPDQAPLEGIPDVESETTVGIRVEHGSPVVKRITSQEVDTARVTLRFPRLIKANDKGDTGPAKVAFRIDVKAQNESYKEAINQTIIDKNTSPAELSFRVRLEGDAPWDIKVIRLSPDSNTDKLQNELWFSRLAEITETRQAYPYSALVGITAEAEKFTGQVNKREYEVYGLIVDVPTNYDPEQRTYTGLWDGTFKRAWTDNGAWCFYHLLTNKRFGLGAEISNEYLSATKWELYEIARFCDELVPDGKGGMEPRFRFTGVIAKAEDAKKLLDHILSSFRAMLYYGQGAVLPVQDAPQDPSALLTNANVEKGEFIYQGMAASDKVSAVAMSFNDPEDNYKLGIELVVDDGLVQKYGYRQADQVAMFCTSRSQAQRLARHLLFEQEYESDMLEYVTGLEQASVRPGEIIKQSDADVAGVCIHARIKSVSRGRRILHLDKPSPPLPENPEGWKVTYVLPDGHLAKASISAIRRDNRIEITPGAAVSPLAGSLVILEHTDFAPRLWRVLRVAEGEGLKFKFKARGYHPDKYASVERKVHVDVPNYSLMPRGALAAPAVVSMEENLYLDGVVLKSALNLAAEGEDDPRINNVQFQLKGPLDEDYVSLPVASSRILEIKDVRLGEYQARARFVGLAQTSPWTESSIFQVLGKERKPSTPTNLHINVRPGTGVLITIDPVPDLDLDSYSYHIAGHRQNEAAPAFEDARLLARTKSTSYLWPDASAGIYTAFVVAHDTSDQINGGSTPARSAEINLEAPGAPVLLSDTQTGNLWQVEIAAPAVLGVTGIEVKAHINEGTGQPRSVTAANWASATPLASQAMTGRSTLVVSCPIKVTGRYRLAARFTDWLGNLSPVADFGVRNLDLSFAKTTEYIFRRTASDTTRPPTPQRGITTDNHVPSGWIKNPLGSTRSLQAEWVSSRTGRKGTWSTWSTPALFSRYAQDGEDGRNGANGQDGRGFEWRDRWTANANVEYRYELNLQDVVSHQKKSWICKYTHRSSASKSPGSSGGNTYWSLLADQGEAGQDGDSFRWRGRWLIATSYAVRDIVSHGGRSWVARRASSRQVPSTNSGYYWSLLADRGVDGRSGTDGRDGQSGANGQDGRGFEWRGPWVYNTQYGYTSTLHDVVSYQGKSWVCKRAHTAYNSRVPGSPGGNTYWSLLADRGASGQRGDSFRWQGYWTAATTYAIRDTVSYDRRSWVAKGTSQNKPPSAVSTYWDLLADRGADAVLLVANPATVVWTSSDGITYQPVVSVGQSGYQDAEIRSSSSGHPATKWRWTMTNMSSAAADRISVGAFFGSRVGWRSSKLVGIGTSTASVRITEVATGAWVDIKAQVKTSQQLTYPSWGDYGFGTK